MPVNAARSKLHVEGKDDLNVIANLVSKYGIDYAVHSAAPVIRDIGSVEELLNGIETAVRLSSDRVIGFVLDADTQQPSRWQSVRDRLLASGVQDIPAQPPPEGYIGESTRLRSTVGVWIMPDNTQDGNLESFLQTLIRENDSIISHAEWSTDKANELGARFDKKDRLKAIIHAWLAWQAVPGRPYGTAIHAEYFRHDSAMATKFLRWYTKLFAITVASA